MAGKRSLPFRHFPLNEARFRHQFGIRALPGDETVLQMTDEYRTQVELRQQLLSSEHREHYLVDPPQMRSAAREIVQWLAKRDGTFIIDGNRVRHPASAATVPLSDASFEWLGCQLQEDMVLLSGVAERGFPIVAGCVCFPSGWSLKEKLGRSMLSIHREVPEFETELHPPTRRLLERLPTEKTVWRTNWGVRASDQLDQSPRHAESLLRATNSVTPQNAGRRCFFRVEFQTLTRLAGGAILFTIHTEQCRLDDLAVQQRTILRGVLSSCPEETLRYKGITPMREALLAWLSHRSSALRSAD
jgi:hypothetical protein